MEQLMEGKTIFITGATGFLAKILVEKVLRVQPNIKKLFLLVRASDNNSARERFMDEVIGTDLFKVIREKMGANIYSLLEEKVFIISGDISSQNLGIKDSKFREEMYKEIDIIINSAATTNFDERYDIAMNVNVIGAMNILNFAKSCTKLKMLLHVSTAYVCGKTKGVLPETPIYLGETLNENSNLDINVERDVIMGKIKELDAQNATPKEVTIAMKNFGIQRATLHGWPNTYSFTKAMGEMVLGHMKENVQIVIIRPTIITSTYKEPFPGWIEGVRTMDAFILAYGKGVLNFFYGDPDSILDAIPGDMVVNSILAAILVNENQSLSQEVFVYHISSSARNPLKNCDLSLFLFHYFTKNPWRNKDGDIIKMSNPKLFSSMASFRRYITTHYLPILKVLEFVNILSWHYFDKTYRNMKRKIDKAIQLSQLYEPYLFFYGSFDDVNTERLRLKMKETKMDDTLYFDPQCIKWEDYFMNTHLSGAVKYLF